MDVLWLYSFSTCESPWTFHTWPDACFCFSCEAKRGMPLVPRLSASSTALCTYFAALHDKRCGFGPLGYLQNHVFIDTAQCLESWLNKVLDGPSANRNWICSWITAHLKLNLFGHPNLDHWILMSIQYLTVFVRFAAHDLGWESVWPEVNGPWHDTSDNVAAVWRYSMLDFLS